MHFLLGLVGLCVTEGQIPAFDRALATEIRHGRLVEARQLVDKALVEEHPAAPFASAIVRLLEGVSVAHGVAQRHGLRRHPALWLLVRLPLPPGLFSEEGGDYQPTRYEDVRQWLAFALQTVSEVERELAAIEHDFQLTLPARQIGIDFDGSGTLSRSETVEMFYPPSGLPSDRDRLFSFDYADAEWLRGYCHVLMGIFELILAHDFRDQFERTAHLLVAKPVTPHEYLRQGRKSERRDPDWFLDVIASVHLLRFEVVAPERLQRARGHFLQVIRCSRTMWQRIMAETDDLNEWIPNPNQKSSATGIPITEAMVAEWRRVLTEAEAILRGDKLLPFWRGKAPRRGVNVARVFDEMRETDLILWVQGTAAEPYLEQGDVSSPETWNAFNGVFQGRLWFYAVYFN